VRATRAVIGLVGIVVAAVGVVKLLDLGFENLRDTVIWLVSGVISHDGLLAPIVVALGVVVVRLVPPWSRTPVVAGFVVLGSATIMAIPVLGRYGARPDNPSLLDRNYVGGWLVLAGLVVVAAALASWWNRRGPADIDEELVAADSGGHTGEDADGPTVPRTGRP